MKSGGSKLGALIARAGFAVNAIDVRTGFFVDVSPRFCEMLGYDRDELLALTPVDITHPGDASDNSRALDAALARTMNDGVIEKRFVRKDGRVVWARITVTAGEDPDTLLGLVEDVTQRHDEALRAEQRLATLLRTAPSAVLVTRLADATILEVNAAATELLGWSRDELLGRTTAELDLYHDPGMRQGMLDEFGRTGGIIRLELRARHRSGAPRDVILTAMTSEVRGERCAIGFWEDVTELRRIDAALRESEDELRTMFELAPIGIVQVDPTKQRFSRVNERMCAITGYTSRELCAMPIAELTHPDDRDVTPAHFADGTKTSRLERRYLRKDGTFAHCAVEYVVLRGGGNDKPARAMALVEDLTERRAADAALKLQTSALQATANAIVITDTRGCVQWVNAAFSQLTGYSSEEMLGKNPRILKSGRQDRSFYRDLWQTILAGNVWRGDLVNQRKDGTLYDEEMTITPVRGAGGAITHFVAIKLDVTARKRAAEALRASEDRYRGLVDSLDDIVFSANLEGRITFVNEAVRRFGYEPGLLQGRPLVDFVHADDLLALRSDLELRVAAPLTSPRELRWLDAAGKPHIMRVTTRPVLVDGRSAGFTGLATDVTQLRTTEDQLRVAQRMEAVGQLAGGIAHDFNNILGVILSYAELAIEDLREEDPLRADLEQVSQAALRAAGLTRQLLAFSRRQILEPEPVDLGALVDGLSKMLGRLLGEDITLRIEAGEGLFMTLVDRGQIEQVVMNLAVNARDAMPAGGQLAIRTRNIALDAEGAAAAELQPGQYVELVVTDSGGGIDPAILPRIFEPFFTTKAVGKGTGLGLATVHGIVKQSGGGIALESVLGVGTSFRVYLPRLLVEQVTMSRPPPTPRRAPGHGRVLVVEDEEALRNVIRRMLTSEGYEVLAAANAGEALLLCERRGGAPIDLVLTDVVMPEMSGPELARRLATAYPVARVTFMSGYTDDTIERHGALEHRILRKPFDRETLANHVRSALDGSA